MWSLSCPVLDFLWCHPHRQGDYQDASSGILKFFANNNIFEINVYYFEVQIERVSIDCRKAKTKVITLANQKGRRQSSKPIKTRSNYT